MLIQGVETWQQLSYNLGGSSPAPPGSFTVSPALNSKVVFVSSLKLSPINLTPLVKAEPDYGVFLFVNRGCQQ